MKKKRTLILVLIAALVLVGVMLLLIFLPKGNGDNKSSTLDEGVAMKTATDKNGMHQAVVQTEPNGEIKNNSYGTLIDYVPANIKSMHIENSKGTLDLEANTPKGEATVYTLKGYEDFGIQSGIPDSVANAAAKLEFTKVASLDGKDKKEFGLENPRATVTVTYLDKTKAKFIVGSDAPQSAGTYVQFGTEGTIYLCSTETVEPFTLGLNDYMDLNINKSAEDTDNSKLSSVTISGSGFSKEIVLVPNDNPNNDASYRMTAPLDCYANENESSLIEGGLRGLYADSVELVNPSKDQLSKIGLANPYAKVEAVYPDLTVKLLGSKADSDGKTYVMEEGGKVVYKIGADKVPWVNTGYEKLVSEYVLKPTMTALSGVSVKTDKTYDFTLTSETKTTTDDAGEESTATTTNVSYGSKELELGDFTSFYDALTLIKLDSPNAKSYSGSPELSVTYTYTDGSTDKVEFYASGNEKYVAVLNGKTMGNCYKADVTRVQKEVKEVIK